MKLRRIKERFHNNLMNEYILKDDKWIKYKNINNNNNNNNNNSVNDMLQSLFLPYGYPNSVTSDYLSFQIYDTIQAVSSYLRGMLCTQALLIGVGVGNSDASVINATINWFLRDFFGMIGGLIFAYYNSINFEKDIKFWRFFADCINDVGLTLELLSPLFPSYFLIFAALGNLCRALCGVAAGSTRASLSQHFAKINNVGEISAKEGMQETFVTLIGLSLGLISSKLLGESRVATWIVFTLLTLLHIWANYQAMKVLILKSLNPQRIQIMFNQYNQHKTILLPDECAKFERILWLNPRNNIKLGSPLPISNNNSIEVKFFNNYCIWKEDIKWCIGIANNATDKDILKSYIHVLSCYHKIDVNNLNTIWCNNDYFETFWNKLIQSDYNVKHIMLGCEQWRYSIEEEE